MNLVLLVLRVDDVCICSTSLHLPDLATLCLALGAVVTSWKVQDEMHMHANNLFRAAFSWVLPQ